MNKIRIDLDNDSRLIRHEEIVKAFLPKIEQYGYYAIHSLTHEKINVPETRIRDTFLDAKRIYSESLTHSEAPIAHQDGFTRAYKTKEQSGENIVSQITTCYSDGHIVTDGYIDIFCEGDDGFNPNWFIYKIQRHLQLTREVLEGLASEVVCVVKLRNIDEFKWEIFRFNRVYEKKPYVAYHHDIVETIELYSIHERGDKWNLTMDVTVDIMKKIARIFGMEELPQAYWDEALQLDYPHGIPGR